MIRKICQFVVLLVVSPLVLFSLGLCLAWDAAAENGAPYSGGAAHNAR